MATFIPLREYPGYLACSDGYLINTETGYILRGNKKRTGYREVSLTGRNGRRKSVLLHRLLAEAFCGEILPGMEVNHIDGNKDNNSADNLELITHAENLFHAFVTGLREDDVSPKTVICTNIETGEIFVFSSIYRAAKDLGISKGNICMCCQGKRPYASGYRWEYASDMIGQQKKLIQEE